MKRTIEDIHMHAFGYDLLIPKGTITTNKTAIGYDDQYNFVATPSTIKYKETPGGKYYTVPTGSPLYHDIEYRGLNIPADKVQ